MNNSEQKTGTSTNKRILNYATWLLARRRYSTSEFLRKLEKKFPDQPEAHAEIIELFLSKKYLDDTEYTSLYIREQLNRKPQGLRLIKQKLRQKGISETTLSAVFADQLINEDEVIAEALAKKTAILNSPKSKTITPQQRKQKLFRFLVSRGFSTDKIMKALQN